MAASQPFPCSGTRTNEEVIAEKIDQGYTKILPTLPKEKGWSRKHLCQYQGFWYVPDPCLKRALMLQHHFKARSSDVLLVTTPKSGTTWLKALIFSIIHRARHDISSHPLLTMSSHECVPFLDYSLYGKFPCLNPNSLPSPRLLATHIPYSSLPESVTSSDCHIVYLCRNPKDVLVSLWHFMIKVRDPRLPPLSLEEAFELFCEGVSDYGPFWDHVLGYWNASLEWPQRVLFLKFEDMKRQPMVYLKRLAEFLGHPFSIEEETQGLVDQILKLCCFENMSSLEVNKSGKFNENIRNDVFFRQGKVGDSENHLTTGMIQRLDQITKQKLDGSGLNL